MTEAILQPRTLGPRRAGDSFPGHPLANATVAEISGLTRVRVTKAMTHFRQEGLLIQEGADALLNRELLPRWQAVGEG